MWYIRVMAIIDKMISYKNRHGSWRKAFWYEFFKPMWRDLTAPFALLVFGSAIVGFLLMLLGEWIHS